MLEGARVWLWQLDSGRCNEGGEGHEDEDEDTDTDKGKGRCGGKGCG